MNRDPFYAKITERLAGDLDPELFEHCVVDLLRTVFPGLVPIRGGQDAGMDGAVADANATPFPLVTTVSPRCTGNLRRNLTSYLNSGKAGRKVIFATSQTLNQHKRTQIENTANELGFELVQIHDGADLSDRLYRNSKWCKELLNLSGDPSPLSAVPRSVRPIANTTMIGREADAAWLRDTEGDRLLVGQPGSGKTYLLRQLARDGRGLFVISHERSEIAEGIRDQEPTTLIVDDANPTEPLLQDLRQLREATHAEFDILATCWPGYAEQTKEMLDLSSERVHTIGLLAQEEVAAVIEDCGLHCPVHIMNELVWQAEGRPGLAATLANLCLNGAWSEVVSGDRLKVSLLSRMESGVVPLLATIALSGNQGLDTRLVADALRLSFVDVWKMLRDCSAAGVVVDNGWGRVAVRPPVLRYVLVKEVYFGAASLPIDPILSALRSQPLDVQVLVGARARGARVPDHLIIPRLEASDWHAYAALGEREAKWVLETHPELVTEVATPALHYLPGRTLEILLTAAVGDSRPVHSHPSAPMRLIADWVSGARPGTGHAIARRALLLDTLRTWLARGGDLPTALRACEQVMSLAYSETGPLDVHHRMTITQAVLTLAEVRALLAKWPEIMDLFGRYLGQNLQYLRPLVEQWAYPARLPHTAPDEVREEIRCGARRMLSDLAPLAAGHLALAVWVRDVASDIGLELALDIDPAFDALHPCIRRSPDWRVARDRAEQAVRELAQAWLLEAPESVAYRIGLYASAASDAQTRDEDWSAFLCREISALTDAPLAWADAMLNAGVAGDCLQPFLRAAATAGLSGWEVRVRGALGREDLQYHALELVFTHPSPPTDLLSLALSMVTTWPEGIRTWCLRGEVREDLVGLLLKHADSRVAEAAAYGEFFARPKGVRQSLYTEWRTVVLRSSLDHWLSEALGIDSELAMEWLTRHFADFDIVVGMAEQQALLPVLRTLDVEARRALLTDLPGTLRCGYVVQVLVDRDPALYDLLLSSQTATAKRFHLAPLAGQPDDAWVRLARVALSQYSPEHLVQAAYSTYAYEDWTGPESVQWQQWAEAFGRLANLPCRRMRDVASIGMEIANKYRERALDYERREAIYGW